MSQYLFVVLSFSNIDVLSSVQTSFVPEKEEFNQNRGQLLAQMDVAMGGRVAEELIFGMDKVTTGT